MILQTQDVAAGIRYDERRNDVLPQKSLTPKIFHLSVSHRKFRAKNGGGGGDNCIGIFGLIFYWCSVVGNNTYSTYTKMGGDVIALTRAF